jgi:hypothetical protein
MTFGDVVIFTEGGKTYNALVLSERVLEHHLGEDDQPMLNLVFIQEKLDGQGKPVAMIGTGLVSELMQFRYDVVHDSHAFSDQAKKDLAEKGHLPPAGVMPGGRWKSVLEAYGGEQVVSDGEQPAEAVTGSGQQTAPSSPPQGGDGPTNPTDGSDPKAGSGTVQ